MPIRINLLAEELHAADVRRRDPVKRAVVVAVLVVGSAVVWYFSLLAQKGLRNAAVLRNKEQLAAISEDADRARAALAGVTKLEKRIKQLNSLGTNRVLWGTFMNAMQRVVMPDVPLTQLRVSQSYLIETPAPTGRLPRPATSTEIISVSITARDYGKVSDQLYDRFRKQVMADEWIKGLIADDKGINFDSFGGPTPDRNAPDRSYVPFTMRMNFKQVERQ